MKSAERLFDIYCRSVGRNSKLLLNVSPTRDGVLHPNDVASLMAFRDLRAARFAEVGKPTRGFDVRLAKPVQISGLRLEENIEHGQSVARFSVLGEEPTGWRELARGATIGYARIERFAPVTVRAVRSSGVQSHTVGMGDLSPGSYTMEGVLPSTGTRMIALRSLAEALAAITRPSRERAMLHATQPPSISIGSLRPVATSTRWICLWGSRK